MTQDDIAKFIDDVKLKVQENVNGLRGEDDIVPVAMLLNPEKAMILVGIAMKEGRPEDKDRLAYFLAAQAHKHNAVAGAIVWTVWMAKEHKDDPDFPPSKDPQRWEAICIWEFNPIHPRGHIANIKRGGNRVTLEPWEVRGEGETNGRFWDEILPIMRMNHSKFVN